VFAAILAGGRGARLSGVEKGFIEIGEKKVIEYIIEALRTFEKVIVCRDEEQAEKYEGLGCEVICDILKNMGPLGGIHAALNYFKRPVVITCVDMPFIVGDVCTLLYRECVKGYDAVVPVWPDGRFEPTFSAYSPALIVEIEKSYVRGERKVIMPLKRLKNVKFYPIDELRSFDPELISFTNINTPEDLKKAEELAEENLRYAKRCKN
jgi:molybdopterin-guanine dinucleotide biosynthesis protein A